MYVVCAMDRNRCEWKLGDVVHKTNVYVHNCVCILSKFFPISNDYFVGFHIIVNFALYRSSYSIDNAFAMMALKRGPGYFYVLMGQ